MSLNKRRKTFKELLQDWRMDNSGETVKNEIKTSIKEGAHVEIQNIPESDEK